MFDLKSVQSNLINNVDTIGIASGVAILVPAPVEYKLGAGIFTGAFYYFYLKPWMLRGSQASIILDPNAGLLPPQSGDGKPRLPPTDPSSGPKYGVPTTGSFVTGDPAPTHVGGGGFETM